MAYISLERIITGKVKSFQDWIDYVGTDHIHHRLLVIFGDRRKVVFFIFFLCATLGISAITLRGRQYKRRNPDRCAGLPDHRHRFHSRIFRPESHEMNPYPKCFENRYSR